MTSTSPAFPPALPDATRHYINGCWVASHGAGRKPIVNPSDRSVIGHVALGNAEDVAAAVAAARAAFDGWSQTSVAERLDTLRRINAALIARNDEMAAAISAEMGAPRGLARNAQAPSGPQHFGEIIRVLETYAFEGRLGSAVVRREPIGVCALITPWNWPLNQVAVKVAPALAAGCTIVLKPSELSPLDAVILAGILHEVGLPAGVFNLVHGDGEGVGAPLTGHPHVDMVSFTGSTRAGIAISENAARTIKRVSLELGGKSANIILDDADLDQAIRASVRGCMGNSGQSCNAPTRLLVPAAQYERAAQLAVAAAQSLRVGPGDSDADLGPLANEPQYHRVIAMIEAAKAEGATLLTGGAANPAGTDGYFVSPTIFGDVTPGMAIARDEVFGPVLAILRYDSEEQAIAIANDSIYGLSGYVWGSKPRAGKLARQLRTGMVHINGASLDGAAPFGGYKMSGNGREWGVFGLEEFLEVKAIFGEAE